MLGWDMVIAFCQRGPGRCIDHNEGLLQRIFACTTCVLRSHRAAAPQRVAEPLLARGGDKGAGKRGRPRWILIRILLTRGSPMRQGEFEDLGVLCPLTLNSHRSHRE